METETMGRVVTEVLGENFGDLLAVEQGTKTPDGVRRVSVADALVDTGATLLASPTSLIRRLGLVHRYTKKVRSTTGTGDVDVYGPVRLTIAGRECPTDVMEVRDDVPVLVGPIPPEYLDFVIDPRSQKLIGNPAHGGEHTLELY
jgi:hypothetical protein